MYRVAAENARNMMYERLGRGLVPKPAPREVEPQHIEGQCRRHPPTMFAEVCSEEEDGQLKEVRSEYVTRFPVIKTRDWCGEWEPRRA